jgi:LuxR family transcriptional regulator, maltose regulon positive regulatory protein
MAITPDGASSAMSELLLKTTPPRAPRHLLLRPRLNADQEPFRDRPVVVAQAPAGFGKTSLLAQWRREHLARGAGVAWLLADGRDDPQRFLQGLALAVRAGCGRPGFGRALLEGASLSSIGLQGVTAWLAEVAQTSLELVLIVDEAERLPPASAEALVYLLHNAPHNLRVIVGARGGFDAAVADLTTYGACVCTGAEALRFRLDETMALVQNRFPNRVDANACARLHELTEGWPLGLQLALSAMERSGNPGAAIDAIAVTSGDLRGHLVSQLLLKLSAEDAAFLTRISVVDLLHPDLCRALTGFADAPQRLARLMTETPLLAAGEGSDWCRLHTLAREALRARLAGLPAPALAELHANAMTWLAQHGMIEEAARQAHAAGQHEIAYDLAERSLHEAVSQGRQGRVLDWLELIPDAAMERRPRLRLAAAWALALSDRHDEAGRHIARILARPDVDAALQYECALILSAAAYYADEPDRFIELFEPWADAPPVREPWLLQTHSNRLAGRALLLGNPAQARRSQLQGRGEAGTSLGYVQRWSDFFAGLSYLWEGQVVLAEEGLRPALARVEADLGRRHPLACMMAALLAAAQYERDKLDEVAALLANRLDVLERTGTPETIMLAYLTAARVEAAQGNEHRALNVLEAMDSFGTARHLPRLCVAGLAEQVRLHAGRFRVETCRALVQRLEETVAREKATKGPLWQRAVKLHQSLCHAYAAIAARDWKAALAALAVAAPLAEAMRFDRVRIQVMGLRAFAQERSGEDGRTLLREAMNLAQLFGLSRTFIDAHPEVGDWARRVVEEAPDQPATLPSSGVAPRRVLRPGPQGTQPQAIPSMVLTPKEREVLELLARNLSNKEIALAMAIGEETVKWHLKNLFGKLDAGTRKQVVRRAAVLGLLVGAD